MKTRGFCGKMKRFYGFLVKNRGFSGKMGVSRGLRLKTGGLMGKYGFSGVYVENRGFGEK